MRWVDKRLQQRIMLRLQDTQCQCWRYLTQLLSATLTRKRETDPKPHKDNLSLDPSKDLFSTPSGFYDGWTYCTIRSDRGVMVMCKSWESFRSGVSSVSVSMGRRRAWFSLWWCMIGHRNNQCSRVSGTERAQVGHRTTARVQLISCQWVGNWVESVSQAV